TNFGRDYKSLTKEAEESLEKIKFLEKEIERLSKASDNVDSNPVVLNITVIDEENLQTELVRTKEKMENYVIKKDKEFSELWNKWAKKCDECKYDKISYNNSYKDMQQKIERLQAQLEEVKGNSTTTSCVPKSHDSNVQKLKDENVALESRVAYYRKEVEHLKIVYKNLFNFIKVTRIGSLQQKLIDKTCENADLRT
ncbi:hypothetical protein Tco_1464345, partial [Tanacetum coccineum]